MSVVVDYYRPKGRTFMDCLVTQGVSGIARYLTNDASDPRQVTDSEIADAHAAGLEVHFYFEMNPTRPEYFTYAQGAEDCRQAVERLRELGAPEGTVVYFAVDAPPTRVHPETLDEYFNGVESMQTPQITPGIYGYAAHVEYARANFPNVGKHLAQTYGTPRIPLDLWQHEQVAMCGVAVDLNECSVAGWRPKEEDVTDDEFKDMYTRLIAPALEAEFQERKKQAIDEAVDRAQLHAHQSRLAVPQPSAQFFRDLPAGAEYGGMEEQPFRYFFQYPDGSRHTFDALSGAEITS